MQYVPFEEGIEVNGRTVWSIVDGFKAFQVLASEFLVAEGIGTADAYGLVQLDPDGWYSQSDWLRAFHRIGDSLGDRVLYDIGRSIPRNAVFPPFATDVPSAIASVDVAYHMNHRRNGEAMFDPASGRMLEGIGHYGCAPAGERRLVSVCENPYPCTFDHGILATVAERFAASSKVVHADDKPCRRKGANACTYVVTW